YGAVGRGGASHRQGRRSPAAAPDVDRPALSGPLPLEAGRSGPHGGGMTGMPSSPDRAGGAPTAAGRSGSTAPPRRGRFDPDPRLSRAAAEPLDDGPSAGARHSDVGQSGAGLSDAEVAARRARYGPNAVREHRARPVRVLVRQLRSPLLLLLLVTAVGAVLLGERVDGLIV